MLSSFAIASLVLVVCRRNNPFARTTPPVQESTPAGSETCKMRRDAVGVPLKNLGKVLWLNKGGIER